VERDNGTRCGCNPGVTFWDDMPMIRARGGLRVVAWASFTAAVVTWAAWAWTTWRWSRGEASDVANHIASAALWCAAFAYCVVWQRVTRPFNRKLLMLLAAVALVDCLRVGYDLVIR